MDMETIFEELGVIEKMGIETIRIQDGIFEYHHNTPVMMFEVESFKEFEGTSCQETVICS